jgi:hypothetical protein
MPSRANTKDKEKRDDHMPHRHRSRLQEVSGIRGVPFEKHYRRLQEAGKHAEEVAR